MLRSSPKTSGCLLPVGLIVLAGALLYVRTLNVPWYLDDYPVLVDYSRVSHYVPSFNQLFAQRGPALFTFALNYRWGGLDPWGYHLVNLVFHLLSSVLVYLLLLRVVPAQRWLVLSAALVFLAHPLQTQAVNYVVQRMTGLAGLLLLAALYFFILFLDHWQQKKDAHSLHHWLLYALALLCGGLAALTKENTAVLPLLLYLFVRLPLRSDIPRRQLLAMVAPFAAVPLWLGYQLLLAPLLHGAALNSITNYYPNSAVATPSPLHYLFTEFSVLWLYLRLLLLPFGQALDYNYPLVEQLANLRTLLALGGILAITGVAWTIRQRRPLLTFAGAWFILTLAVESSVIPLDPVFEHRLYLPMFGFCIALLDVAQNLSGRRGIYLLTVLLGGYALLTWQRNALWTDKAAFYEDNLRQVPQSERVLNLLAIHYIEQGQLARAAPLLRRALDLNPLRQIDYGNLALLYVELGNFDAAAQLARDGLRRFPADSRLLTALGQAQVLAGDVATGRDSMQRAVALNPHAADGEVELSRMLMQRGRLAEGIYWLQQALAVQGNNAALHDELARLLRRAGQQSEARREMLRAVELAPDNSDYLREYGLIALELGDRDTAKQILDRLERLNPSAAATVRNEMHRRRP